MDNNQMLDYVNKLRELKENPESVADLHTHTISSDGAKTVGTLIKESQDKGLAFLAITDHNTTGYIRGASSFASGKNAKSSDIFVEVDGLTVIPGTEITNRCYYARGRQGYNNEFKRNWNDVYEKFHMVVLGADRNPNFAFNKLLSLKHKSDILSDYGVFGFLNKEFGTEFTLPEIKKLIQKEKFKNPNFQYFKPAEIVRVAQKRLAELGNPVPKNEILDALNSKDGRIVLNAFQSRLNLDSADVITLAKCAGGTTIWAHPHFEVKTDKKEPALDELIKQGLDGVEMYYTKFIGKQNSFTDYLNDGKEHKEKDLLWSGGSDFHTEANVKNRIGKAWGRDIKASDLSVLDELFEKQQQRTKALINGEPLPYSDSYLAVKLIDKYQKLYNNVCQDVEDLVQFDEIDYLNRQLNGNKQTDKVLESKLKENPEDDFFVDDELLEEVEAENKKNISYDWKETLLDILEKGELADE